MRVNDQYLRMILENAGYYAANGRVLGTQDYLREAERRAAEVGLDITERVQKIEKTAYRKGVKTALREANSATSQGRSAYAGSYLRKAREYAAEVGLDITERVQKIEEETYRKLEGYYKQKIAELRATGDQSITYLDEFLKAGIPPSRIGIFVHNPHQIVPAQAYVDGNRKGRAGNIEIIVDGNPDIRTGKMYKGRMAIRYHFS